MNPKQNRRVSVNRGMFRCSRICGYQLICISPLYLCTSCSKIYFLSDVRLALFLFSSYSCHSIYKKKPLDILFQENYYIPKCLSCDMIFFILIFIFSVYFWMYFYLLFSHICLLTFTLWCIKMAVLYVCKDACVSFDIMNCAIF